MNENLKNTHSAFLKTNIMLVKAFTDGNMDEVIKLVNLREFATGYLNGFEQALDYILEEATSATEQANFLDKENEIGKDNFLMLKNGAEIIQQAIVRLKAENAECFESHNSHESIGILKKRGE